MLQDKDRIFTNLYGLGDRGLKGAMARGAWDGTKGLLEKGKDWVISEMKASGLRAAAARASPRASNGPSCPSPIRRVPHILWSTPTSRSRAPARIARSCAMIRISSSKAA